MTEDAPSGRSEAEAEGDGLHWIPFDNGVLRCLDPAKGAVKQCGRHAVIHLEKAWRIREIDPEMAVFRAITAEEEAASALFHLLREKRYSNSKRLGIRRHTDKQAVIPFLGAVQTFFSRFPDPPFEARLRIEEEEGGGERLRVELVLRNNIVGQPEPPLNFSVRHAGEGGDPPDFKREFEQIAGGAGKQAQRYVDELAGLRNELLYADHGGVPSITEGATEEILRRQGRVMRILKIVCLESPYRERTLFVQQGLDAFLKVAGRLSSDRAEG